MFPSQLPKVHFITRGPEVNSIKLISRNHLPPLQYPYENHMPSFTIPSTLPRSVTTPFTQIHRLNTPRPPSALRLLCPTSPIPPPMSSRRDSCGTHRLRLRLHSGSLHTNKKNPRQERVRKRKFLNEEDTMDDTRGTRTLNLCHRKATPYH